MKRLMLKPLVLAAAVAAWSSVSYAADTPPPVVTDPPATETPDKPEAEKQEKPDKPAWADNSERRELHTELKKMLDEMHAARDAFLKDQEEIREKLKDASKSDRETLRAELKTKREEFLQQQAENREEAHKRMQELRNKLKEQREVLKEAVRSEAKEKAKERNGDD